MLTARGPHTGCPEHRWAARDDRGRHTASRWAVAVFIAFIGVATAGVGSVAATPNASSPSEADASHSSNAEVSEFDGWWETPTTTSGSCEASVDLNSMALPLRSTSFEISNVSLGSEPTADTSDGLLTLPEVDADSTPCEESNSSESASNNLCLEAAGVPATIRPALIAKYTESTRSDQLGQMAGSLDIGGAGDSNAADSALEDSSPGRQLRAPAFGVSSSDAATLVSMPLTLRLFKSWTSTAAIPPVTTPKDQDQPRSCSIVPAQCDSLPPVPPGIDGEASSPMLVTAYLWTDNDSSDNDEQSLPAYRPLGPSDGYGTPPDPPPRSV